MDKVWVVFVQYPYEGSDVAGIFSTEELAQAEVDRLDSLLDVWDSTQHLIEEWKVS